VHLLVSETPSDWSRKENGGLIDQCQRMVRTQSSKDDDRNDHARCRSSNHLMPVAWQWQIDDDICKAIELGHAGHECDVRQWRRVLELPVAEVATHDQTKGPVV
jgi:hypothetical protein